MKRLFIALLLPFSFACGGGSDGANVYDVARNPVSVRGWFHDVKGSAKGETVEMELARRAQMFAATSVWVEDAQFASGGVSENGAFIILDVPPQNATIGVNAPGAESAQIVMKDIPPTADVFLPDVILENGGATFLDPTKLIVRVPASISERKNTGRFATINGVRVPIVEAPVREMVDRRDYPDPGGVRPVAIVK